VASFLTNFLHGIGGGDHIKDYRHASNLFTHDNFRLAPKTAFLYHCLIKLNRQAVAYSGMSAMLQNEPELSFMVKAVDLPRMSVDIEELNQYNRKTFNMTKVNYSPVSITFHDDNANTIRDFLAIIIIIILVTGQLVMTHNMIYVIVQVFVIHIVIMVCKPQVERGV